MSEVKRFTVYGINGAKSCSVTLAADFDRVTAERDAALERAAYLKASVDKRGGLLETMASLAESLQQRLTAADELLDQAVTALNEIARVSQMGEKPFEIATLAIGEMSAPKPAEDHPYPVSLDGCDGSCAP